MRYLSVCAGIEAATVAWHPLGWQPVAFSEIEKFPSAVLQHHYPDVPNYGDMTEHENWPETDVDVLVGGTPCQSFSVAGLRQGMRDPRGNLALTYLAIAQQYRPDWLVWENVPGVLSSNGGRDFGAIIGGMVELGYCPSWRVLDAQYFGVPQRRRRVFVVASARDWRDSAKVLFEPESLLRHPAPSREAGKDVANALTERPDRGGGNSEGQRLIPDVVGALTDGAHCGGWSQDVDLASSGYMRTVPEVTHSLRCRGFDASEDGTGRGTPIIVSHDPACSLTAREYKGALPEADLSTVVAFAQNQRDEVRLMEQAGALAAKPGAKQQRYVSSRMAVRRLTPHECERLQGFPDNYTNIPGASDSARYKALGNSMAVPVMRWIGKRINDL